jgi:hypothetical protein
MVFTWESTVIVYRNTLTNFNLVQVGFVCYYDAKILASKLLFILVSVRITGGMNLVE